MNTARRWRQCVVVVGLILVLCSAERALAVSIDLSGVVIAKGTSIFLVSDTPVAPARLYDFQIEANGVSTGSFVSLLGDGDLGDALDNLDPGLADQLLQGTFLDLPGTFPTVLRQTAALIRIPGVPIGSGSIGTLVASANIRIAIGGAGRVHFRATDIRFRERSGGEPVPFNGTYTITSGTLTVRPAQALSVDPQPDLAVILGPHRVAGVHEVETSPPGTAKAWNVLRGAFRDTLFIVRNDGPATDDFVLSLDSAPPASLNVSVFRGAVNVTSQIQNGGLEFRGMAPGAMQFVRVRTQTLFTSGTGGVGPPQVERAAVTLRLERTSSPFAFDLAGVVLFIR